MTKTKTGVDQRLVRAIGHPLRLRLLTIFNERVASPSDLAPSSASRSGTSATTRGSSPGSGCVELVKTKQVRGAVEHYYRRWSSRCSPTRTGLSSALDTQVARGRGAYGNRRRHGRLGQAGRLRPRRRAPQPHAADAGQQGWQDSTSCSRSWSTSGARDPGPERGPAARPTARGTRGGGARADAVRAASGGARARAGRPSARGPRRQEVALC